MMFNKVFLLVCCGFVFAVAKPQRGFDGGLLLGLCAAQIDGDNYKGYNKAGLVAGGYVSRYFNNKYGAKMELKFIGKGASKPVTEQNPRVYKVVLNYVSLPLLLMYRFNDKLSFDIGAENSILIKAKEDLDGGGFTEPLDGPYEQYELAGIFGVNYNFSKKFAVNLSHGYSFTPIGRHPGGQTHFTDKGLNNRYALLTLQYKL
ncbi:MAG: PorT family protein [Bacteroidales bacterium]|nr:PorT family protein [Bacteroidales bacterium]